MSVDYMVVAGGGGGGGSASSGGAGSASGAGAGGYRASGYGPSPLQGSALSGPLFDFIGDHTITVGAGGALVLLVIIMVQMEPIQVFQL